MIKYIKKHINCIDIKSKHNNCYDYKLLKFII